MLEYINYKFYDLEDDGMTIYVIQEGDTIDSVAQQFDVTPQRIITDNELPNPENLLAGQSLGIQKPITVHTVAEGDTLYGIAEKYGVNPLQILQNNPFVAAQESLNPGTTLVISFEKDEGFGTIITNGYAYPYIDRAVLRKTLPFLTYLSIFTYGFTPQGDLVPAEDDELIKIANEFGTAPMMVLSPMSADGNFNSRLAHDMFINAEGQANLINNIVTNLKAKGYRGLDIDFEFVLPEDKQLFIDFVTNVKNKLEPEGFLTMVALAPKTSGEQAGLLYAAHDYPTIGAIADKVLLMTYEWGFKFSAPMATAPLNQVRKVLEYGISVIDPSKILMGIPNYAYDWPLPYVKGETQANTIGNQEAIQIAAQFGANIKFDEEAQAPFFEYTNEEGIMHVVWFDDIRSMNAKYRSIPEYKLTGSGCWQIMKFFPGLWMVVNSLFSVAKK
jgi:spore germination protein